MYSFLLRASFFFYPPPQKNDLSIFIRVIKYYAFGVFGLSITPIVIKRKKIFFFEMNSLVVLLYHIGCRQDTISLIIGSMLQRKLILLELLEPVLVFFTSVPDKYSHWKRACSLSIPHMLISDHILVSWHLKTFYFRSYFFRDRLQFRNCSIWKRLRWPAVSNIGIS